MALSRIRQRIAAGLLVTFTLCGAKVDANVDADDATTMPAAQPSLRVGDRAPPLVVDRWLKGEPVTAFQPGTIYVLEFWATWCGPCIQAIPDLTWLQRKYPQVVFIGIDVMEEDARKVEPFVRRMGDRMNYRVAADLSPGGDKGGPAWNTWMEASGTGGIPASFIIAADGRLAEITHPSSLRRTLDVMLGGKPLPPELTDAQVATVMDLWKQYREAMARKAWDDAERTLEALLVANPDIAEDGIRQALRIARGDYAAAEAGFAALDRRAAADDVEPSIVNNSDHQRLWMFAKQGDAAAMNRHAAIMAKRNAGDAAALNLLAWRLIGEPRGTGNHLPTLDLDLLLDIATQAVAASEATEPGHLDTLARVHALRGEFDQAVAVQEKAVGLIKLDEQRAGFEANAVAYRAKQVN